MAGQPTLWLVPSGWRSLSSELPLTLEVAEFTVVRAGAIDVGYAPTADLPQLPAIKQRSYQVFVIHQYRLMIHAVEWSALRFYYGE
jgi:hypothetical protein